MNLNKAILVIDMPNSCKECMCYVLGASNNFCEITRFTIFDNTTKPNHCPLKPMPEKIDIPDFDDNIKVKSENAKEVGMYMYDRGVYRGYNICIDKILGQ